MGNKKISDMTQASDLTGNETLYVVQGNADRKTTVDAISNKVQSDISSGMADSMRSVVSNAGPAGQLDGGERLYVVQGDNGKSITVNDITRRASGAVSDGMADVGEAVIQDMQYNFRNGMPDWDRVVIKETNGYGINNVVTFPTDGILYCKFHNTSTNGTSVPMGQFMYINDTRMLSFFDPSVSGIYLSAGTRVQVAGQTWDWIFVPLIGGTVISDDAHPAISGRMSKRDFSEFLTGMFSDHPGDIGSALSKVTGNDSEEITVPAGIYGTNSTTLTNNIQAGNFKFAVKRNDETYVGNFGSMYDSSNSWLLLNNNVSEEIEFNRYAIYSPFAKTGGSKDVSWFMTMKYKATNGVIRNIGYPQTIQFNNNSYGRSFYVLPYGFHDKSVGGKLYASVYYFGTTT